MKKIIFLAVLISAVVFTACKKKKTTTFDLQEGYFPIEQGRYVVYDVQEVVINAALEKNDTSRYFLKTLIGAIETDNSGRPARKFERYIRYNANDPWVLKDIWTTIRDGQRVEIVEENQRVIRLVLAPDKVKEWNMNAYNMLGTEMCYYDDIHLPGGINGNNFDSTVKVVQADGKPNFVEFKHKYERYAKNVGLIHKYYKDYLINFGDTTNIRSGNEIIMKLVAYGKE